MPDQRRYTVWQVNSLKMGIVWTRGTALARAWAADKWGVDPVFIDVWPTIEADHATLEILGDVEHYA